MLSSQTSHVSKLLLLSEDYQNYHEWAERLLNTLKINRLSGYTQEPSKERISAVALLSGKELLSFDADKSSVDGFIRNALPYSISKLHASKLEPWELWSALKAAADPKSSEHTLTNATNFVKLRKQLPNEPIASFLNLLSDAYNKAQGVLDDSAFLDAIKTAVLLSNVNDDFLPMVNLLMLSSSATVKYDDAMAYLSKSELSILRIKEDQVAKGGLSFSSSVSDQLSFIGKQKGKSSAYPGTSSAKISSDAAVCFACKKPSHMIQDCNNANALELFLANDEANEIANARLAKIVLRSAKKRIKQLKGDNGKVNSIRENCELLCGLSESLDIEGERALLKESELSPSREFLAVIQSASFSNEDVRAKQISKAPFYEVEDRMLMDSGASYHYVNRADLLHNFRPCIAETSVANGNSVKIYGLGELLFEHDDGSRFIITNVRFSPGLSGCYFSIPTLQEKDWSLTFQKGKKLVAYYKDTYLFTEKRDESSRVYFRTFKFRAPVTSGTEVLRGIKAKAVENFRNDYQLHLRLGHPSIFKMREIARASEGQIKLKNDSEDLIRNCVACIEAKAIKQDRPRGSRPTEEIPLAKVHSDVLAMPSSTHSGKKYVISFLDDSSRYAKIELLEKKSESLESFISYRKLTEKQLNYPILSFHSDNGGEYMSEEFSTYLREHGIVRSNTNAHCPDENGVAERFNRTLAEMVRATLFASSLPVSFWGEAAKYCVYIYNHTPHRKLKNKTPFESLTGKKTDVSQIRTFGSRAYVIDESPSRKKLDKRTRLGMYVGVDESANNRFYIFSTGKVVTSRDVIFDESILGFPIEEKRTYLPITSKLSFSSPHPDIPDLIEDDSESESEWSEDDDCSILPKFSGFSDGETVGHTLPQSMPDGAEPQPPDSNVHSNGNGDVPSLPATPSIGFCDRRKVSFLADNANELTDEESDIFMSPANAPMNARDLSMIPPDTPLRLETAPRAHSPPASQADLPSAFSSNRHQELPPLRRSARPKNLPGEWWVAGLVELDEHLFKEDGLTFLNEDEEVFFEKDYSFYQSENFVSEQLSAALMNNGSSLLDPKNRTEALTGPFSDKWIEAEIAEINQIFSRRTISIAKLPPGKKAIPCKMVYKVKRNNDGSIDKLKARLVACGNFEKNKSFETFAPTTRFADVRAFLAIACSNGWEVLQFDTPGAFLNGKISREVYLIPLKGYTFGLSKNDVWKLLLSIYGLPDAPKIWSDVLTEYFSENGFTNCPKRPCLWKFEKNGYVIYVLFYVDDMLLTGSSGALIKYVADGLITRFKLKCLGKPKRFLGWRLDYNQFKRILYMDQQKYIEDLIEGFPALKTAPVRTVRHTNLKLAPTPNDQLTTSNIAYAATVGALLFLSNSTRPDIAEAVSEVAKYMKNPSIVHVQALIHIMRYLRTTKSLKLKFNGNASLPPLTHADANFANDDAKRRSRSGFAIIYAGATISYESKMIKTVCTSTAEAETVALHNAFKESIAMSQLFSFFGIPTIPWPIFCDSQSSICIANSDKFSNALKHIDVKYHAIHQAIEQKRIKLLFVKTQENIADGLTKALAVQKHDTFVARLGLVFA